MAKSVWFKLWILLPVVAFLVLIARFEYQLYSGEHWIITVEGFDPRDLLRGQYLQFRMDFNWKVVPTMMDCGYSGKCCLLLEKNHGSHINPLASLVSCQGHQNGGVIPGQLRHSDWFDIGMNRYYIPEAQAKDLEKLLRNKPCAVELVVAKGGRSALLRNFLIDGKPWQSYLRP